MVKLSFIAIAVAMVAVVVIGFVFAVTVAWCAEKVWLLLDQWSLNRKTREAWRDIKAGRVR